MVFIWSCWWTDLSKESIPRLYYLQFHSFHSLIVVDFLLFQRKDAPQIRRLTTVNPTRHYQQFKIRAFRFWNDYDTVYFHCKLLACHHNYPDSRLVSNYSVTLQTREVGLNSPCWILESCKMCQPTFLFLLWLMSNRWNAFTKNIKSGLSDVIDEFCDPYPVTASLQKDASFICTIRAQPHTCAQQYICNSYPTL